MAQRLAQRRVGERARPAPWNSRIIDDVADNRPWNLVVKALRTAARARLGALQPGPSILMVNWNTGWLLCRVLPVVLAGCPAGTTIRVVDNGSRDGSVDYLRSMRPQVTTTALPVNAGHAVALDIGVLTAPTDTVVILDSDAFPYHSDWLARVVDPIGGGVAAAGLRASREFVHPAFMALDVRTFVRERLSFQVHRVSPADPSTCGWGVDRWDTGELLSRRLGSDRLSFLEVRRHDLGLPGVTVGGVVYHHGGLSRGEEETSDPAEEFDRAMDLLLVSARGE